MRIVLIFFGTLSAIFGFFGGMGWVCFHYGPWPVLVFLLIVMAGLVTFVLECLAREKAALPTTKGEQP